MSDPNGDRKSDLAAALAKARVGFDDIRRNRTVEVTSASGRSYSFAYATLDAILAATLPALAAQGISVLQTVEYEDSAAASRSVLATYLIHTSGEERRVSVPFLMPGGQSTPQAVGSALTYARRYGYSLALCLAAEEDDDGNAASGNSMKDAPAKPRVPRKTGPVAPPADAEKVAPLRRQAFAVLQQLALAGVIKRELIDKDPAGSLAREGLRQQLTGVTKAGAQMTEQDWLDWVAALTRLRDEHVPGAS